MGYYTHRGNTATAALKLWDTHTHTPNSICMCVRGLMTLSSGSWYSFIVRASLSLQNTCLMKRIVASIYRGNPKLAVHHLNFSVCVSRSTSLVPQHNTDWHAAATALICLPKKGAPLYTNTHTDLYTHGGLGTASVALTAIHVKQAHNLKTHTQSQIT